MTAFTTLPKPAKRGPKPRKPIARKSRPARVRRTEAGKEEAALNALWSRYIKARDPVCRLRLKCNGAPTVDPCHIYPKGPHPHIRWEPSNGLGGCRHCHDQFDGSSAEEREAVGLEIMGYSPIACLIFLKVYRQKADRKEAKAQLKAAMIELGRAA